MQDPIIKIANDIKTARQELGMSIEDLAEKSKVSVHHVKNIEELKREDLPEDAYLTGFLQKILKSLGFKNINDIIQKYRVDSGDYVVQTIVDQNASEEFNEEPVGFFDNFEMKPSYIAIAVLVLIFLVFILSSFFKTDTKIDPRAVKTKQKVIETKVVKTIEKKAEKEIIETPKKEEPEQKTKELVKEVTKKYYKAGSGSKDLKVKIKDTAWFQVIGVAADMVLFEGDVFKDSGQQKFEFKDDKGFILATGNAGAFQVSTDDGSFVLGKEGELIKWYYPDTVRTSKKTVYKQQNLTF